MSKKIALFHVSPSRNDGSIWAGGIDPAFAKTARRAVWTCEINRLTWALAHVSFRHKVGVNNLTVWVFSLMDDTLIRTKWLGVYQYTAIIPSGWLGVWDISQLENYILND